MALRENNRSRKVNPRQGWGWALVGITLFVTGWALLSGFNLVNPLFLPSPKSVALALYELASRHQLLHAIAATLWRIFKALLLTMSIGVPLGILIGSIPALDALFEPFLRPMRYLPITALLPLFILWFGIGDTMKIAFLFTGTVVYLIPLTRNAVHDAPEGYLEVGRDLGFSPLESIFQVRLPNALPQIWDAIIVCNAISWTYVVLAEIINPENGLGYLISIAGRLQRSDLVFASLIVIGAIAILTDRALLLVRKRFLYW